jgi:glycosyltransferase involved in cell wall biosynthesis
MSLTSIALLTDGLFPAEVGGMQKHAFYLAQHLAKAGVSVDLHAALPADLPDPAVADNDRLRWFRVDRATPRTGPGHYIRESYRTSVTLLESLRRRPAIDLVYAQGFAGWEALRQKAAGVPLPPIAVHFHGFEMWQRPASFRSRLEQGLLRPFVRRNLQRADATLLLGRGLSDILFDAKVFPRQFAVSANGIDANWLVEAPAALPGPRRFVFVGRHERRKGLDVLHAAIARLGPDAGAAFEIVGPIPTPLRLALPHVTYHGLVRKETRLRDILRSAHALVCPSLAEGLPTVILEAMASGLVVVATDVGAVRDLVDTDNGWLVAPGQVDDLVAALGEAIHLPAPLLREKQAASLARVRASYLWDRVAADTIQALDDTFSSFPLSERHACLVPADAAV